MLGFPGRLLEWNAIVKVPVARGFDFAMDDGLFGEMRDRRGVAPFQGACL